MIMPSELVGNVTRGGGVARGGRSTFLEVSRGREGRRKNVDRIPIRWRNFTRSVQNYRDQHDVLMCLTAKASCAVRQRGFVKSDSLSSSETRARFVGRSQRTIFKSRFKNDWKKYKVNPMDMARYGSKYDQSESEFFDFQYSQLQETDEVMLKNSLHLLLHSSYSGDTAASFLEQLMFNRPETSKMNHKESNYERLMIGSFLLRPREHINEPVRHEPGDYLRQSFARPRLSNAASCLTENRLRSSRTVNDRVLKRKRSPSRVNEQRSTADMSDMAKRRRSRSGERYDVNRYAAQGRRSQSRERWETPVDVRCSTRQNGDADRRYSSRRGGGQMNRFGNRQQNNRGGDLDRDVLCDTPPSTTPQPNQCAPMAYNNVDYYNTPFLSVSAVPSSYSAWTSGEQQHVAETHTWPSPPVSPQWEHSVTPTWVSSSPPYYPVDYQQMMQMQYAYAAYWYNNYYSYRAPFV